MMFDEESVLRSAHELNLYFKKQMDTLPRDLFLDSDGKRAKIANPDCEVSGGPVVVVDHSAELKEILNKKILRLQELRNAKDGDTIKMRKEKNRLKRELKRVKARAPKVLQKVAGVPAPPNTSKPSGPVYNKDARIMYSKFELIDRSVDPVLEEKMKKKLNKKGKAGMTGKNLKGLLKRAESQQSKIASLKETDPEKAMELENKEKWKKAFLKTEGVKVKDDVGLLKKAIKREDKKKARSRKTWSDRQKTIVSQKQVRQDKRTKNLERRKDEKKKKLKTRAMKKGRYLPELKNQ